MTPPVTILCATGIDEEGGRKAVAETSRVLPIPHRGVFVWKEGMTRKSYSHWMLRKMPSYVQTPFVLIVQADGYARHPEAWSDEFMDYDYLGAPWEDGTVGNGGFSLRSKAMIDACKTIFDDGNEDLIICRRRRGQFEKAGLRFAPKELAIRFSYELPCPGMEGWRPEQSFGFHGRWNL